jgi:hypothetical protein
MQLNNMQLHEIKQNTNAALPVKKAKEQITTGNLLAPQTCHSILLFVIIIIN